MATQFKIEMMPYQYTKYATGDQTENTEVTTYQAKVSRRKFWFIWEYETTIYGEANVLAYVAELTRLSKNKMFVNYVEG